MKAKQIQIVPAKAFQINPNSKYLLIMPETSDLSPEFSAAVQAFFGETKILVLASRDVNKIKLTELLQENE